MRLLRINEKIHDKIRLKISLMYACVCMCVYKHIHYIVRQGISIMVALFVDFQWQLF